MPHLNTVVLAGHLVRDPEVHYSPSGAAVAKLGLAVNTKVKKNDEWVDEVLFVDVVVFGKPAEWCAEHDKGEPVLIDGRLRLNQWKTQDGQNRSKIEVLANKVQFLKYTPKESSGDEDVPF